MSTSWRCLQQGGGPFLTLLAPLPPCCLFWALQYNLIRCSGSNQIVAFERWTKMLIAKSSCKMHECKHTGIRISPATADWTVFLSLKLLLICFKSVAGLELIVFPHSQFAWWKGVNQNYRKTSHNSCHYRHHFRFIALHFKQPWKPAVWPGSVLSLCLKARLIRINQVVAQAGIS